MWYFILSNINRFILISLAFFGCLGKQWCHPVDFQKDSIQVRDLLKSAQNNAIVNFPKAISETRNALSIAQRLNNNKLKFSIYRIQGDINENNNHLNEAAACYEKALALQDSVSVSNKLDIYLEWAIINKKLANYDVTMIYYQYALNIANKVNDLEMVEFVYSGLGTLNCALSEFDKSIEFHLLSKEVAEKRQNTEGVISAYVNISTVYIKSKNYQLAYNALKKGFDLALEIKDSMRIAYILNAYGKAVKVEKKYSESISYHLNALKYCKEIHDKAMIAQTLGFLADVYTQMGLYNNAENTFKKCFTYKNYFDFYEQPNLYLSLGSFYAKTKRPVEAKRALSESLTLASNRGFIDLVQKTHRGLVDVYQQLGQSKQALKHMRIAKIYSDSVFNTEKIQRLAEAQYKFETNKEIKESEAEHKLNMAKSEKEIQELNLTQKRIILILSSILLVGVLVFAFFYIEQKNKNSQTLSQKNIEIISRNNRLEKSNEILQQFAYASAHDLKEPLRSISGFVSIINKRYTQLLPPESAEYMNFVIGGVKRMETLIAALLEYSTLASDEEDVKASTPIKQVLKDVKANLNSVVLDKNAVIEISGYLPMLKISQVHLTQLFQNLIGNAIKFCDMNPLIQVTGKVDNEHVIFKIKDNGIGMKKEYSDKAFLLFQRLSSATKYEGTGIGLAICKQIVDKYEGSIRFDSVENEGTTFIVSFPVKLIEAEIKPLKIPQNINQQTKSLIQAN